MTVSTKPRSLIPSRHQVLLWRADLPRPVATRWLDDAERRRAASFRDPADRDRFALGRSMLRALLAANLEIAPESVELRQEPGGRPRLADTTAGGSLRWSVSHSGPVVVVALARRPVGVDVEHNDAGRSWSVREARVKAGDAPAHLPWRTAGFTCGAQHRGVVVAPGIWFLRRIEPGPQLP